MCGLAGIVAFSEGPFDMEATLQRMAGHLQHGGPDGHGALIEGRVGLVHARLGKAQWAVS